ncbi:MAG: YidC/Oxa1 family membrane protein insertase [Acidimicrobiia bacterium]
MFAIWDGIQSILGGTLTFFYGLIPNFGIAIILLTISVGLLMFRLTLKQTRSMKAMQEIQPEIKRIQRELKHDKQASQAAMMELYKERGVNPAAGCLPLLLQMPVWFALFSVLRSFASSNPLRWVSEGSELEAAMKSGTTLDFLWMDLTKTPSAIGFGETIGDVEFAGDLVSAIPYFITIIIVMATAYWQQRQTMARSNNQAQPQPGQAVMKIFPFFFGFISFNMPAGLVVYFAASQIFRIGQQALIIKLDEKHAEQEVIEAKEDKKTKKEPKPSPPQGASGAGSGPATGPKRRPQGSKKKRGKKRRRR